MASVQRILPHLSTAALSFVRKPSGALGTWDQTTAIYAAQGARYIGPNAGAGQIQATPSYAAIPNGVTHALLIAQFCGDPLRAQDLAAGNWVVGFAAQLANAGATFTWEGNAALFVVNGFTGQRRATVFDTTTIGSTGRTNTGERTCLDVIAGQDVAVSTGDYLVLELGIAVTNGAAALAPQASLFSDGTTPITTDDVAATSALAVLEAPAEIALSLPQAGEQPGATLTVAQAVQLLKEHWPPDSGKIYNWDDPSAEIYKVMQFLGDWLKLYAYDQADRLFRELNPLTTVELLPAWESLLGISLSQAALRIRSADQRRQQVLARLREMGPLTVYNVAAIFAQLANYAPGTIPDVIEFDKDEMMNANATTYLVSDTIPVDTGFGASNLITTSPVLLDGGVVDDAGALIIANLTNTNSEGVRFRLTGPDFVTVDWEGGPSLSTNVYLRSPAHAGRSVHGRWTLNAYRVAGSPVIGLNIWSLYVLGKRYGGRGQQKFDWSVYLDPAHQQVDRRDIQSTLDRITQSYAQSWVVNRRYCRPGTGNRAGRMLPGAA